MTEQDMWSLLVVVLLVVSIVSWIVPWSNYIIGAYRRKTVNNRLKSRVIIRIVFGATLSGVLFVILALLRQIPSTSEIPVLGYVYLFTICPSIFVLLMLAGFLASSSQLNSKRQASQDADTEQDQGG
jgi:threonine/homoserine/homoserine lactone efflux protein